LAPNGTLQGHGGSDARRQRLYRPAILHRRRTLFKMPDILVAEVTKAGSPGDQVDFRTASLHVTDLERDFAGPFATETEAWSWLEEHAVELDNNNCAEMRGSKSGTVVRGGL